MHVVRKLFPEAPEKEKETGGIRRILTFTKKKEGGVRVQGVSNILIRFAQCCQPLPGEAIVGIVTRGRGISVHRLDCPNTFPSAIEAEYVAAFREYLAIQPTPDPELLLAPDWIRATGGVLREAEMELAAALELAPQDPLLQQRMASLRAQQLDWFKRMAAVERNSRRIST